MALKSNITGLFERRGKFGIQTNSQGEDGHVKIEAETGVVLHREYLGTSEPGGEMVLL